MANGSFHKATKSFVDSLLKIPLLADVNEDQLAWFASHSHDEHLAPGELLAKEGGPAEWLFVIIEGEIRAQRESAGTDAPAYIAYAGEVMGVLPFSRMTKIPVMVRALLPTRGAKLHKHCFP